jgi:rhodanese-related sulfurtransferase
VPRRNLFADDPKEAIRTVVSEELEPFPEVFHRRLEIFVRTQIATETPIFLVELDHRLRVRNRRFDLAATPDHTLVLEELVNGRRRHPRNALRIEAVKRAADVVPLRLHDAPREARLEGDLAEDLEIVRERLRSYLLRRHVSDAHPTVLHPNSILTVELQTITTDELFPRVETGNVTLVDALAPMVYAHSHLPGAINLPLRAIDPETIARRLPDRHAEIVVYCTNPACDDSVRTATRLIELGYTNVRHYADGKDEWRERGLPLERAGKPFIPA